MPRGPGGRENRHAIRHLPPGLTRTAQCATLSTGQPSAIVLTAEKETKMKQTQATAICPITGISVQIADIPALPFALEYSSPLSHYRNAVALASLSHKELLPLSTEIKAAVILAILRAVALDGDHLPAVQKNKILSGIFAETAAMAVTDLVHEFRE